MNKILLIDKPAGWTSFDVVAKIRSTARKLTGDKKVKVGHAGTLDPFATGLLIVLVGKESTKQQDSFMKQDKEYVATLRLGFISTTGDPEGEITEVTGSKKPSSSDIECVLAEFSGHIEQIPPIFSAIKVDGIRAYKLAREGKAVEMKPRQVQVYEIENLGYSYPELKIRVKCSSGTYIRTLAEDIGNRLGGGAYLTDLRRTRIGEYNVEDASSMTEDLQSLLEG